MSTNDKLLDLQHVTVEFHIGGIWRHPAGGGQ